VRATLSVQTHSHLDQPPSSIERESGRERKRGVVGWFRTTVPLLTRSLCTASLQYREGKVTMWMDVHHLVLAGVKEAIGSESLVLSSEAAWGCPSLLRCRLLRIHRLWPRVGPPEREMAAWKAAHGTGREHVDSDGLSLSPSLLFLLFHLAWGSIG
jgi:hypothetical protein